MSALFVTGTDTGVGKTLVATVLMHAWRRCGLSVVGMKPVAAGCRYVDGQWRNDDVDALHAAATPASRHEATHPYLLREPIAPHLAARREGRAIDLNAIRASYDALRERADVVVVEGAGGFLVPLNGSATMADIARSLALPVVLVVGMRLGCINHALLTHEAILARGLPFSGWVANVIEPDMGALDENIECLRERLTAPLLGRVPFRPGIDAADIELALPAIDVPGGRSTLR